MKKPLEGCLIVDLTTFVAAPTASRLLADLGARVIKIEPPQGDAWRGNGVSSGPKRFSQQENPIFDLYNNGKDLISLNLKSKEGMDIMLQLLSKADVFITNNRPASLAKMGLDYETLHKKFPRLIYGIVLGFGAKGPESDKKAFDTTAYWTRTGFLLDQSLIHDDGDYEPVAPPSSVGDSYTGSILAMQVLAAILQRQTTGEGQLVSSTLYHVGLFAMATMLVKHQEEFGSPLPATRVEIRHSSGALQCADGGWLYMVAPPFTFMELAGREDLVEEIKAKPLNSPEYKAAMLQALRVCAKTKTVQEWLDVLKPLDTAVTPMPHYSEVTKDPQAWANDFIRNVEYPTGYTHRVPTSPIEMECVESMPLNTTKAVGEDTAKVLSELGYTPQQIAEMTASGAVICK